MVSRAFRALGRPLGLVAVGLLAVSMAGCGLADTATTAAASGTAAAEQAKEAHSTIDHVKQQLDDAARQSAEQREAAEKDAE